jgi:hypothetical protein
MTTNTEVVAMALSAVPFSDCRDAVLMICSPQPGVAFRPALMALGAITLDPTVAFIAIGRILSLFGTVYLQPIRGLMIFRQRFLGMASSTRVRRFFAVVAFVAGNHRRTVPFSCLGVMDQAAVAINALQTAQFRMRVMWDQQIAGWRNRPLGLMAGVAAGVARHLNLTRLGWVLGYLHNNQLDQVAAEFECVPKTLLDVALVTRDSRVSRLSPGIVRPLLKMT